jgi:hypothetical protein
MYLVYEDGGHLSHHRNDHLIVLIVYRSFVFIFKYFITYILCIYFNKEQLIIMLDVLTHKFYVSSFIKIDLKIRLYFKIFIFTDMLINRMK